MGLFKQDSVELSSEFSSELGIAYSGWDPYFRDQALLFLDADRGVLKSGGTAASYLDAIPTWENQAASEPSYLYLPGIAANYASVPDAADLDGFGDFTLEFTGALSDWTADNYLITKTVSGNQSYFMLLLSTGKIRIYFSSDGSAWHGAYDSTVATGVTDGTSAQIRAVRDGTVLRFYVDGVQLGDNVTVSDATIYNGNANLQLGMREVSTLPFLGKFSRARIWSDATQTTKVLDVNFAGALKGATSFVCATGQTVTIHSTASNAYAPAGIQRARGSDALQATESLQPKLLTPSANNLPVGHLPGVVSNYFSVPDAANLDTFTNFTLEAKGVTLADWTPAASPGLMSKYKTSTNQRSWILRIHTDGTIALSITFNPGSTPATYYSTVAVSDHYISDGDTADIMAMRDGTVIRFYVNGVQLGDDKTGIPTTALHNSTEPLKIGMGYNTNGYPMLGSMTRARVWNSAVDAPTDPAETPVLDVNFEVDATHGDSSFTATSGQTVTVHTSGLNPARVIGYPVIRTDGVDDFFQGQWAQLLTDGRMFLVATSHGAGSGNGRHFNTSSDSDHAEDGGQAALFSARYTNTLRAWGPSADPNLVHEAGSSLVRFLHDVKIVGTTSSSRYNGGDEQTDTTSASGLAAWDWKIGTKMAVSGDFAPIDIEFLGLYPASMTDADAAALVTTLNTRFSIY